MSTPLTLRHVRRNECVEMALFVISPLIAVQNTLGSTRERPKAVPDFPSRRSSMYNMIGGLRLMNARTVGSGGSEEAGIHNGGMFPVSMDTTRSIFFRSRNRYSLFPK